MKDRENADNLARECLLQAKELLDQRVYSEPVDRRVRCYIELSQAYVQLGWLERG